MSVSLELRCREGEYNPSSDCDEYFPQRLPFALKSKEVAAISNLETVLLDPICHSLHHFAG
jgi:hypothetical protein